MACGHLLRKIQNIDGSQDLSKIEIKDFISHNLWKQIIEKNQEFDQFVIDKQSSTFLHFEVKSMERMAGKYNEKGLRGEYKKPLVQLGLGREMFVKVLAPNCNLSANWAYQGKSP